jgi:hypothetical protein
MRNALARLLLSAALLVGASSAHAAVATLARTGAWQVFGGNTTEGPICGMSLTGDGWGMVISDQGAGPVVHLRKDGWTLPRGAQMTVAIQFNWDKPVSFTAQRIDDNEKMLRVLQPDTREAAAAMFTVMSNIKEGVHHKIRIMFPGSSESDWYQSLRGIERVWPHHSMCIRRYLRYAVPTGIK